MNDDFEKVLLEIKSVLNSYQKKDGKEKNYVYFVNVKLNKIGKK